MVERGREEAGMWWRKEEEREVEDCLERRSERGHNMLGVRRAIV